MQVLIATDAWHPQINGVVRTLQSLTESLEGLGATVRLLTPDGFASVPLPTYPGLRCALPRPSTIAARIEQAAPDAIHIATEGPIGFMVRRYCMARGLPFTTSFTTRFPEYIAARAPFPVTWGYAALRRFHEAATITMVSTQSLMAELAGRGFPSSRCGAAASIPSCSGPNGRSIWDFRARSSCASAASPRRRTWRRSYRWTCPAARS